MSGASATVGERGAIRLTRDQGGTLESRSSHTIGRDFEHNIVFLTEDTRQGLEDVGEMSAASLGGPLEYTRSIFVNDLGRQLFLCVQGGFDGSECLTVKILLHRLLVEAQIAKAAQGSRCGCGH